MQTKRKVALIDDNFDNREVLQVMLSDRYQVASYASGRDALDTMRENLPDIVLLDIAMPEMDGTDVIEEMKMTPELSRIPVIAVTAQVMLGDREKYLAAGFDDYVAKPISDYGALYKMIEDAVGRAADSR